MANRMERNYELMKHPGSSLKDSMDILRNSVKDLYELDEDNYQAIKALRQALEVSTRRVDKLTSRFNRLCRLTGIGLILTGVSGLIINAIIDEQAKRIEYLESKERTQKEEESDG